MKKQNSANTNKKMQIQTKKCKPRIFTLLGVK
jgi:hypothetical protein